MFVEWRWAKNYNLSVVEKHRGAGHHDRRRRLQDDIVADVVAVVVAAAVYST